jgi:hypothetical protein
MPLRPFEYDTEMRYWNVFTVHLIRMRWRTKRLPGRVNMRHQLMTEEIEIDPLPIGSPLGTSEQSSIELPSRG